MPNQREQLPSYHLRGEARSLQQLSEKSGTPMRFAQCLEAVARERGFRNWNACVAQVDQAPAMTLQKFLQGLRELERASTNVRHFVCEGSPLDCSVAIIGANPGTTTPFWSHVDEAYGMDRLGWLKSYVQQEGKYGRSRAAIERIVRLIRAKVIELNAYSKQSSRLAQLSTEDRCVRSFEYTMRTVMPRVAVCAGVDAARAVQRLKPGWPMTVLEQRHFIYWGREAVRELAAHINQIMAPM